MAQSGKPEYIGYGSLENLHRRGNGEGIWTKQERELWEPGYHPSEERTRQKIAELDAQLANMQWISSTERIRQIGETSSNLKLVLLGKPGVGKSATANTLVGREVFPTDPGMQRQSFTTQIKVEDATHKGTTYRIIDTPSLSIDRSRFKKLNPITDPLAGKDNTKKPDRMVYLYVAKAIRFTQELKDDITRNLIRHPDMLDRTIGIVTHGNEIFDRDSVKSLLSRQEDEVSFVRPLNGLMTFKNIIGVHNYNDYTDRGPCSYVQERQRETVIDVAKVMATNAPVCIEDRVMRIPYESGHACLCFCPRNCQCQCLLVPCRKCIWSGKTRLVITYTVITCMIVIGLVLGLVLWEFQLS